MTASNPAGGRLDPGRGILRTGRKGLVSLNAESRIRLPRRSLREWGCFGEAVLCLGLARLAIGCVRFRHLSRRLGRPNEETPAESPRHQDTPTRLVSWAIDAAGRRTPWKSTCLVRALAAHAMLHRRGISSTLYLGVDPGSGPARTLDAHAWLRSGTCVVTGGEVMDRFTPVASFADPSAEARSGA